MLPRPGTIGRGCFLTLILLTFASSLALATHLVDHRFTVYGTVRDGRSFPGTPLAGKAVVVRLTETGQELQRGVTDAQGKFSLVLHVHNTDSGKDITVHSEGLEKTLALQFDPTDATKERRARVELILVTP